MRRKRTKYQFPKSDLKRINQICLHLYMLCLLKTKFVSLEDIRKSLNTLNETSLELQDFNEIELTRSFFEWIVEREYDLITAMHQVDAWAKQEDQKKYIERFRNGEFNQFLKHQTWAEQMEDGYD